MAKMFYKTTEAAEKLGVNADQLKDMVAQGKLREFRDGANVMFKVDQVDRLAGDKGKATGAAPSDSGIDLAPSGTGTSDSLNLQDSTAGGTKEDTVMTNLEGSSVFDSSEVKAADPKGKTDVAAAHDEVSLEGVGSGSGLLDLTLRESDETSLGAELLDEIYPGGEGKADSGIGSASGIFEQGVAQEHAATTAGPMSAPMGGPVEYVEAGDAASGAFGGLSFAAILFMLFTFIAAGSLASGYVPEWVSNMAENTGSTLIFAAILVVVAILAAGVGYFVSKAATR